jgi:hypothetical protein
MFGDNIGTRHQEAAMTIAPNAETVPITRKSPASIAQEPVPHLAGCAEAADEQDLFVGENYASLKRSGIY